MGAGRVGPLSARWSGDCWTSLENDHQPLGCFLAPDLPFDGRWFFSKQYPARPDGVICPADPIGPGNEKE